MMDFLHDSDSDDRPVNPDDLDEIDGLFFGDDIVPKRPPQKARRASRIVALISPKGGTGKTSIAVMLAGMLSTRKRQAAVMDLDPRGSVRRWAHAGDGLPFRTYAFDATQGAAAFRRAIHAAIHDVDLLVIDTPPAMGPASALALQVADLVLIPVGASNLDLSATKETIAAAQEARHGRAGELPRVVVVPSRQDSRTRLAREFAVRLERLEVPVAPAIGQRVEVAVAASSGRLVRSSSPAGDEFRRLARSVSTFLKDLDD